MISVEGESFSKSRRGEMWVRCTKYKQCCQEVCVPENNFYMRPNCDSKSHSTHRFENYQSLIVVVVVVVVVCPKLWNVKLKL